MPDYKDGITKFRGFQLHHAKEVAERLYQREVSLFLLYYYYKY